MKHHKHLTEEHIIDIALGNRNKNKHAHSCETCKRRIENWEQIFLHQTNETPSEHVKEKLWKQVIFTRRPTRKKQRKTAIIYSFSAIAALFVLFIGLDHYQKTSTPSYEIAFNDEIDPRIQHEKETKQIAVIPVADFPNITGNLWINDQTNELLLEVDGLKHLTNNDYQLWIIYGENKMDGEILSIQDGTSRIFLKGNDMNNLKLLKGSVEPLGGSIVPTGPEMFIIPLMD